MVDANAGKTVLDTGAASTGAASEPTAALWQITNDLFNLSPSLAQGQVTYAKPPNQGYQLSEAMAAGQPISRVSSLRDAVGSLYKMPPEQLSVVAQRMYDAGFYPPSSYAKGVRPPTGQVMDDATAKAAMNLFQTVVGYYDPKDNSKSKTVDEVLDMFTKAGVADQHRKDVSAGKTGNVYTVTTEDPATLRDTVHKTAQQLLGRDLSDQERDALVSKVLGAETKQGMQKAAAGQATDTGQDTILQQLQIDAGARTAEDIKAAHPAEYQATAFASGVDVLHSLLKEWQ